MAFNLEKRIWDDRHTTTYHRVEFFPSIKNADGDQIVGVIFASYGNEDEFKVDNKPALHSFPVQIIVNKQEYLMSGLNFMGYIYTKAMLAPEFSGATIS